MTASVPTRLVPGKTVLLVCDLQERFRQAIFQFDAVTAMAAKMVRAADLLDVPVLVTEQNARVPELGISNLPPHLNPLGKAIDKTHFSMMVPEIEQELKRLDSRSVMIVGIESHVCVLQTTLDMLQRGISVHVLADAVSSCNAQEIPIALERLRAAGAHVSSTESALFEYMGDAKHTQFRAISALIKDTKTATKDSLHALRSSL